MANQCHDPHFSGVYLKAGNMVVWGDLLAWFVSDLFLSSTKVTALHAMTPFWF